MSGMGGASACPTRWSGGFNTAVARPATAFSSPACGAGQRNDLAEAVSFTAEENGERLFTGVVDECERGWDTAGGTLPWRAGEWPPACWTTRRWGQTTRWPLLRISCGTTWPLRH